VKFIGSRCFDRVKDADTVQASPRIPIFPGGRK
jgi:hypothetical protein